MGGQDDRPLEGLSVVVVEDDALSLEVLCQALESYGAKVAGVDSVAEARALLGQTTPDIVLTDIHLGGDTGIRLLEWLRSRREPAIRDVPVIAVTAYPRQLQEESANAFAEWLMKPLMMDVLRDAILRAVAPSRNRRAAGL